MTTEPVGELVRAVAGWGLPTERECPRSPLDEQLWHALLAAATRERVVGLLAGAVASNDWPATDDQRDDVFRRHREWMGAALRIERRLVLVAEALDGVAVPFIVLKGTAAAHLDYHDPEHRCFGDADILVPGAHIDEARRQIEGMGGTRRYPEPRPGFDRRFSKGLSLTLPGRIEIDVHRTLASGPFGLAIDTNELAQNPDLFALGGRDLPALRQPHRFLHACYHSALGSATARLVPLRDLAQTAPVTNAALDDVLRVAQHWRSEAPVALAVVTAMNELGWRAPTPLAAWAASRVASRVDNRWLAGYVGTRRAYGSQAITAIEAIPGTRARTAYLYAVLFPADASAGDARRERWKRGMRALRTTFGH